MFRYLIDSKPLATKLDDGAGTNEVSSTNRLNDSVDEQEMSAAVDTSMESINEASQLDNTVSENLPEPPFL